MYGVLFVCLGNICRSPSAEGMLRRRLEQEGLQEQVFIDSAGMHDFHAGSEPDIRAIQAAMSRGYSLDGLLARKVAAEDFSRFDLILGMDFSHKQALERIKPKKSSARIALLLDYAKNPPQREVPDPYYGGAADFEYALDLIEAGVEGLIDHIRRRIKSSDR